MGISWEQALHGHIGILIMESLMFVIIFISQEHPIKPVILILVGGLIGLQTFLTLNAWRKNKNVQNK